MKKWLILLVGALTLSLILSGCGVKGATYDYDLSNYVTLGQYKGVEVSVEEIETEMQNSIDSMLDSNKTEEVVTEGSIAAGDSVNITYAGKINGELFDGGSAENVDLVIGSGSYIDGFESGLIGRTVGETVILALQFPEDYTPNPTLAGSDVEFEVTIHSKKVSTLPEYNDEFIAGLENDYSTIAEYETDLRNAVKEGLVWSAIMNNSTVTKYPEKEVKFYYDTMLSQYETLALQQYGTSLEAFVVSYMGTTFEEFLTSIVDTVKQQVQKDMVTYAIAKAENIKADSDDYDEIALKFAQQNGFATVAEYKAAFGKPEVDRSIILDKIVDLVTTEAVEK